MKINNWIDRKYPQSKSIIKKLFDEQHLKEIKERGYRLGKLKNDYHDWETKYKKGTLFIFKRYKEYDEGSWTGEFNIHGVFKCKKGLTESGYHSVPMGYNEFTEVKC